MKLISAPRPICGSVLANGDANAMLRNLASEVRGFQSWSNNRVGAMESAVQTLMDRSEANALGIGFGSSAGVDPEYSRAFAAHFRSGTARNFCGPRTPLLIALQSTTP